MNKKKILGVTALSVGTILLSVILAYGLSLLFRQKNVAETGNVLGIEWYDPEATEFVIKTKEELYDFAALSDFYTFENQTVKLGADIVVNEGNAQDWKEKAPAHRWVPISKFKGVFDGQGHTISGLYGRSLEAPMGLFTYTHRSCTIQDLKLVNSYFETRGSSGTGSFSGTGDGKFLKLYSDTIINCKGETVGGIVGCIETQATLDECWYDGDMRVTGRESAGLVATILNGRVTIKHCLFSGNLVSEHSFDGTRTGGMVGRIDKTVGLNISDTLVSGKVNMAGGGYSGSIIGVAYSGAQIVFEDSYDGATCNYPNSIASGKANGAPIRVSTAQLTGVKAYQWTSLDFNNYWAAVENEAPVLKYFADQPLDLAGVQKEYDMSWYTKGVNNFTITTPQQLYGFQMLSNTTNFAGVTVKLGADIVLNEGKAKDWLKEGAKVPEVSWNPMGSSSLPFAGTFDGDGHSISGLYINKTKQYNGLFGITDVGSMVKNLKLTNSLINCVEQGEVNAIGGIAAELRGSLDSVYSNIIIVTDGYQVGGLIGRLNYMDTTYLKPNVVQNCWFDGEIHTKTNGRYTGGIAGIVGKGSKIDGAKAVHTISNCLSTGLITNDRPDKNVDNKGGQYVGGLFGSSGAFTLNVTDCLSAGRIEAEYKVYMGSAFGRVASTGATVNLNNVYATNECFQNASGTPYAHVTHSCVKGGVILFDEAFITGVKGYQNTTLDFDKYWAVVTNDTPILKTFATKVPSLSGIAKKVDTSWYNEAKDTYTIDSLADLNGFNLLGRYKNFKGKTVKLGADIVFNASDEATVAAWRTGTVPENIWNPIGNASLPFEGTFDGQGHTITGIYVKDTNADQSYSGVFGVTGVGSKVQNFRLVDSYFERTGQKTNVAFLGSIVGEARGTVESVYSNAVLVTDGQQVGGIVGRLNYMDETYTTANVVNNCWFDGEINGAVKYTGGIVGLHGHGSKIQDISKIVVYITNCLNTGYLTNKRVGTADGFGGQYMGGILGSENGAVITMDGCVNAGKIDLKYTAYVGGIIGRVKTKSTVLNLTNTYLVREAYGKAINGMDGTQNGNAIIVPESLISGYNGYKFTSLDFDKYWAVREDAVPALKNFVSSVPSVAGMEKMIDTSWYKADAKTMTISTLKELYGLAIISGYENFSGKTIKLGADIVVNASDAATVDAWRNGTTPENIWSPIGSSSLPFAGTFDGQGHTIEGLYLKDTGEALSYSGVFGVTNVGSVIRDFRLVDSYLERTGGADRVAYLGSIVGEGRGDIEDIYTNAVLVADGQYVGGIVGRFNYMDTTYKATLKINNCWFDGEINGAKKYTGGIAGATGRGSKITEDEKVIFYITDCLNTGFITNDRVGTADGFGGQYMGGIIGGEVIPCRLTIDGCVNAGSMDVTFKTYANGILGRGGSAKSVVTIKNSYSMKESWDGTTPGPAGTVHNSGKVLAKSQMTDVYAYVSTDLEFTGNWAAIAEGTPILRDFMDTQTEVFLDIDWYKKGESPYIITTGEQMYALEILVNGGKTFKDEIIQLGADIYLNGTGTEEWIPNVDTNGVLQNKPANTWKPMADFTNTMFRGTFTGLYEGKVHSISGIYVDADAMYAGLFGAIGTEALVENLILKNSYIGSTGDRVGAVAGSMEGSISKIYAESSVIVKGDTSVGGFVGFFGAGYTESISNCWYAGKIYSTDTNVGGIVGDVYRGNKTIKDCLFTGELYNTKTADAKIGGIAGYVRNNGTSSYATLENCVSTGLVSVKSKTQVGSVVGYVSTKSNIVNKNVYTTNNITGATFDTTNTVEGYGNALFDKAESLKGKPVVLTADELKGNNAYINTSLSLRTSNEGTEAWVATEKGPQLALFTKETPVYNFTGQKVDVDWYYSEWTNETGNKYKIDSSAGMYGLGALVNTGVTTFAGDTVSLTKDIDFNPGWTPEVEKTTYTVTNLPANGTLSQWVAIGVNDDKSFDGTFDGANHVIRGLYLVNTENLRVGLFGYSDDMIKNLRMEDSYISSTKSYVAAISSTTKGSMDNVYIGKNVTVKGASHVGGMMAMGANNSKLATISNCWFDGTLYATGNNVGSMFTWVYRGKREMVNCLNTGTIISARTSDAKTGGLIGTMGDRSDVTLTMKNCLSVGEIHAKTTANVGSVIGYIGAGKTITTSNIYTEMRLYNGTTPFTNNTVGIGGVGSGGKVSTAIVNASGLVGSTEATQKTKTPGLFAEAADGAWVAENGKYPILSKIAEYWR